MIFLCACYQTQAKKCTLQVYADSSLEKMLPLVGDKYLVTDGKGSDIQYVFDTPDNLLRRISSGESCDILLTSSVPMMNRLLEDGMVTEKNMNKLLESPMAMITSGDDPSLPIAYASLFYQMEIAEDDILDEGAEMEGYSRYLDVLWEQTAEEDWQDEWDEQYAGLWIKDTVSTVGILSLDQKEGSLAKDILNQDGKIYDLLEQIGRVRYFDTKDALLEAVRTQSVQVGVCMLTDTFGESNLQTLIVYDRSNPMVTVYVSWFPDSAYRKEAKEMIAFLQGRHARKFFGDFGFYSVR